MNVGSHFFKGASTVKVNPLSGAHLTARAIGASNYTARAAASGQSKDLGAAMGMGKANVKKTDRAGIYPKGPKV